MNKMFVASLVGVLLISGTIAAAAEPAQSTVRTPSAQPERFVGSCVPVDENGKNLPNPNAGFLCSQIRDMRSECAMQERLGNKTALAMHCFGFDNVAEVEPAPAAPARYTSGKRR